MRAEMGNSINHYIKYYSGLWLFQNGLFSIKEIIIIIRLLSTLSGFL